MFSLVKEGENWVEEIQNFSEKRMKNKGKEVFYEVIRV